jgi:uncharacterized protein YraI
MKRILWSMATTLLLAMPFAASAADGYTTGNVNLRAGPDVGYPAVDMLPVGTPIDVQGCTPGWEWCDVVGNGNRGWIAGNYIQYMYNNQPVLVPAYGSQIGIPIVTFSIGAYWGRYYSGRPFYRDRARWYSRPMPHRPPPPPLHRPPVRPPGNRPGPGPRPPGNGGPQRPNPGQGNRPPPRPQPGGGNRPTPPGGNRPTPGPRPGNNNRPTPPGSGPGGNRPPPNQGNRPPQGGARPQTRPAPANKQPPANRPKPPPQQNGNNGN